MKFLPLVWKNIWRRKFRTTFTLLSIFIAFLLFGILMTIRNSFALGVEIAGLERLVLINKVSLIMPLPFSYQARLQSVPGVEMVTHNTWFNGIYQDPANFFADIAVDPEPYMTIYPEFGLPPEQMTAWLDDRQGAIVGRDLAERFGWKVGDRVPLQGTIYRPQVGDVWEFNISGIYDAADGIDKTQFFFRYDYLEENRTLGFDTRSVVVSVLVESMALGAMGGLIGGGAAYLGFNGYQTSTINFQTFSQVAFAFRVTPDLLGLGLFYALAMGAIGGLLPALRACRFRRRCASCNVCRRRVAAGPDVAADLQIGPRASLAAVPVADSGRSADFR